MNTYSQLVIANQLLIIVREALAEIELVLQRMRHISVQADSATLTATERIALQEEIDLCNAEIDRISREAEEKAADLSDDLAQLGAYLSLLTSPDSIIY